MLDLILNTGETLKVDQVILCTGVAPDTTLATKAGLEIDPDLGGYLVNSELQARSDLYVVSSY